MKLYLIYSRINTIILSFRAEAIPPAEFNSLRQKVSIMENELSNNIIKLNSAEKAKTTSVAKCTKLEEEIKKLKGTEVSMYI